MSNLEHVFELALNAIHDGYSFEEWVHKDGNYFYGNVTDLNGAMRRNGRFAMLARLSDGTTIALDDIWTLAQYVHPLIQQIEDLKEAQNE